MLDAQVAEHRADYLLPDPVAFVDPRTVPLPDANRCDLPAVWVELDDELNATLGVNVNRRDDAAGDESIGEVDPKGTQPCRGRAHWSPPAAQCSRSSLVRASSDS